MPNKSFALPTEAYVPFSFDIATLYVKNTLHYTGCCWEGSLYVSQNKLLSVYDENAASPQDNLMLGLQLTLRGL